MADRTEIDWDAALERFREFFPRQAMETWATALGDTETLGRVIRDILVVEPSPHRRGPRKRPEIEDSANVLELLSGADYTTLPFPEAVDLLLRANEMTRGDLASKLPFGREDLDECLDGGRDVDAWTMHHVAAAFNKRGDYFAEYRSTALGSALMWRLDQNPDFSATLLDKVTRGVL